MNIKKASFYESDDAWRYKGVAEAYRDCSDPTRHFYSVDGPPLTDELRGKFRWRMRYYAREAVAAVRREQRVRQEILSRMEAANA